MLNVLLERKDDAQLSREAEVFLLARNYIETDSYVRTTLDAFGYVLTEDKIAAAVKLAAEESAKEHHELGQV